LWSVDVYIANCTRRSTFFFLGGTQNNVTSNWCTLVFSVEGYNTFLDYASNRKCVHLPSGLPVCATCGPVPSDGVEPWCRVHVIVLSWSMCHSHKSLWNVQPSTVFNTNISPVCIILLVDLYVLCQGAKQRKTTV